MVVTNKCISEIQEKCEGRNGDLIFRHLLGKPQSHVITTDDVTEEAKVGELFKTIYPADLHMLSTKNDAEDVEPLRFSVTAPSDSNTYKKKSEDVTLLSKRGTVQFLQTKLSKLDKSKVAVTSSSLCLPIINIPADCISQADSKHQSNIFGQQPTYHSIYKKIFYIPVLLHHINCMKAFKNNSTFTGTWNWEKTWTCIFTLYARLH